MANMYVFKRKCGFGSDNSYNGRILVSASSGYGSDKCYTTLGKADLDFTGTQWVPKDQETKVLQAVGKKALGSGGPPPKEQVKQTITKEAAAKVVDDSSGSWFSGTGFGDLFGGSIEFGKKKTWLPFLIVGGVIVVFLFGRWIIKAK